MATSQCSNVLSLPDLVWLEIFTYLSYEDALHAFIELSVSYFTNLLIEHGAFRRICLSSTIPRRQYVTLFQNYWRPDLVRSLVLHELLAECIYEAVIPRQLFPLLTDLRLIEMRYPRPAITTFILAHAHTLTQLTITPSFQKYALGAIGVLLNTVLPHLTRLVQLDTGCRMPIRINWAQLPHPLYSLEHLQTCASELSDIYAMATKRILPRLRSLRFVLVYSGDNQPMGPAAMKSIPDINSLHLPMLESLEMDLRPQGGVVWASVKPLTLPSVMPRLRDCTLIYRSCNARNVRQMFSTPVFFEDERNVRVRFAIHLRTPDFEERYRFGNLYTGRYNERYVKYFSLSDLYIPERLWYTRPWPHWADMDMAVDEDSPMFTARSIQISGVTPLYYLARSSVGTRSLIIQSSTILHKFGSDWVLSMMHIRELFLGETIEGVQYLLERGVLPNLRRIRAPVVVLFNGLASLISTSKSVDAFSHVVQLMPYEHNDCFDMKHWHMVLAAFPHVRSLVLTLVKQSLSAELANLFIDYLKTRSNKRLVHFSIDVNSYNDTKHDQFIDYLEEGIKRHCSNLAVLRVTNLTLNVWA